METMRRVLGVEYPDTLSSMNNLANSFLLTRFMRWIVAPSLENYLLLPDIM
jgi:hypothetical protein